MAWQAVEAVVERRRLADWAEDFPAAGDVFITGGLHRGEIDKAQRSGGQALWGHHQVVETSSGLVVGGAGFHGPPKGGGGGDRLRHRPVASGTRVRHTEAVSTLVSLAWSMPEVVGVIASTDADNVASQRVLEKAGFRLVDQIDGCRYRIERPLLDDT